jgi:hypothetical protein
MSSSPKNAADQLSEVPPYLSTPPRPAVPPPTVTRAQELPFGELAWEDFERLCLRLVRLEADVVHCQLYGTAGQDQEGIDLYAKPATQDKYRVYQCKRENDFGPTKIKRAVAKFLDGAWVEKTATLVLCTKESLVEKKRADELEAQRKVLAEKGIRLGVWDSGQLSSMLKGHPGLVDDFFGRAWVEAFCGADAISPARPRPRQHLLYRAINFQGRGHELDRLAAEVRQKVAEGTSLSFVGLKGLGGIGKTALAAELAERLWQEEGLFPGGVLWTNLQEEAPEDAARRWVADLGGDAREMDPETALRRFHELAAASRPLVVLDNVPRPGPGGNPAEPLLVKADGVATLLTTRFREAVPGGVRVEELDVLPADEARGLLRSHVGSAADDDPAAEEVLGLCERLPLFLNVAGRAVANGYYSLAGYAEELRRRGLEALADEDPQAAAVFDLSWGHLSAAAKEVFAVLALSPGEDVGPNLVQAWLGQPDSHRAVRLLAELANASLLTPVGGRPGRFHYHDRVRDYARQKLPLPEGEVRRRLLACWTDWDMVRAEFDAVGGRGLDEQYLRLRAWGVDEPTDFAPWFHFAYGQAGVLGRSSQLFFQQAYNEPVESPVSRAAQQREGTPEEPVRWLEWVNRPQWVPPDCLTVPPSYADWVYSVAVTADGRVAVSGSSNGTVRAWDLVLGRCTAILESRLRVPVCVAVTADGRVAVSGSLDGTVRVWDLVLGRCTASLEGHTDGVSSVAVTADGRVAVSTAWEEKKVRVWDLAGGRCTAALEGHANTICCVAVTADGRVAVSGSEDGTVRAWDLAGGRCTAALEGHTRWVRDVAVAANGRAAASRSADGTVRVWDLARGCCLATHPDTSEDACKAWEMALHRAMPPALGPYGLTLRDSACGGGLTRFPYAPLFEAACSADGRHIVAGDGRGGVFILRLHTRSG